jgi:tetratricopeptide (TPR) repeat protein
VTAYTLFPWDRLMSRLPCQLVLLLTLAALSGCGIFRRDAHLDYRTIEADPNHDTEAAKAHNAQAIKLLEKDKTDKAEQLLQKALIADVTYGPAHNNLGRLYFLQEKHYLAAWEFEYAIKLMPERCEPYNNLGLVYETAGKFNEAIEAYESARKLQPSNPEILGNLARARLRRGDPAADVRPLLADLSYFDTRPCWVAWAREQLALSSARPAGPSLEMIPAPPGGPLPGPPRTLPSEQELRFPAPAAPMDRKPTAIPIGAQAPVESAGATYSAGR